MFDLISWVKVSKNEHVSKLGHLQTDGSILPYYKVMKLDGGKYWNCFVLLKDLTYKQLKLRHLSISDSKKTCNDISNSSKNGRSVF